MLEWIIIGGLVVAMYIVLYRYEKKMNIMQKHIDEHHDKINDHHERINKNHGKLEDHKEKIDKHHEKLEEHHNYIEEMWVTIPKKTNDKKSE